MMQRKRSSGVWLLFDRLRGKIRLRSIQKQREKEAKRLMPRKAEIVTETFEILDSHLRSVSLGQVGGFRPPEDIKTSWFGDVLVGKPGESWPKWKPNVGPETYLTPLAQFNLTEMPYVPDKLKPFQMITVFIDAERLPFDKPCGQGWLVRGYKSLDELVPLQRPSVDFEIKAFPMKWELLEGEGPSWEDAWEIVDLSEFNIVADSEFFDRYENSERTKIGGYPALIQGELGMGLERFVFQIGSEAKAEWGWGDCGVGYFGLDDDGQWLFEWTCY